MSILKTKLHRYCVPRYSDDAQEIDRLRAETQGTGAGSSHIAISGTAYKAPFGHTVEGVKLDTKFLFGNQWNEAKEGGRRLFDHYEEHAHGVFKNIRYGHWLEITPELAAIRAKVHTCGYCGKHYDQPTEDGFCSACLGSEYLEQKALRLLRLLPVATSFGGDRPELSEAELANLLPRYREAQGLGKEARNATRLKGLRAKVAAIVDEAKAKAEKEIAAAQTKQDAFNWLLDHDYRNIDNVIFYSHTGRLCFGWRKALSKEEASHLETLLCEFPFDYELKRA